jgi:hypothetical protein
MMKKIMDQQKGGRGSHGAEIMRQMMAPSGGVQEKPEETIEEESHGKGKHE